MSSIDIAVLALYPPVIVFSGWAVWLYVVNVLIPAYRSGVFNLSDHALVLAFALITSADFLENIYYGFARIDSKLYSAFSNFLPTVGILKTIILAGTIFAVAGYRKAITGQMKIAPLAMMAWSIWFVSMMAISWII